MPKPCEYPKDNVRDVSDMLFPKSGCYIKGCKLLDLSFSAETEA